MKVAAIKRKELVIEGFKKYLPEAFVLYVVEIFLTANVKFKIVNGRKTKLGDFRAGINGEKTSD